MLADGHIDPEEQQLLEAYADARGMPRQQLDQFVKAMQAGQLTAPEPETEDEAREWLKAMAVMAWADGVIAPQEKHSLMTFGQRLGMTEYDVKQLILRTRRELYQQSKQQLRAAKRAARGL